MGEMDIPFGNQLPVVANAKPKESHFMPRHFAADFDAPVAANLIRNTLPSTGIVVISGKEKSGKTFLAMSLVLSVASGECFWQAMPDRKISDNAKDGVIIYISAEGQAGFRLRKKAHAIAKGWNAEKLKTIRFMDIQAAPNVREKSTLLDLIAEVKKPGQKIIAIVIDTVARTMHGNENDGETMAEYIDACDFIVREFNTLVLLVHHIGKDGEKGMRGHSSLPAVVDVEIRVEKKKDIRSASILLAKDFPEADGFFHFKLKPIDVGHDVEGNAVTSCIVLPCEAPDAQPEHQTKRRNGAI